MTKFYLIISFLFLYSCSTTKEVRVKNIPKTTSVPAQEIILDHGYFKVFYNKKERIASYVTYDLKKEHLIEKVGSRKDKFIVDPILVAKKLPYVNNDEYEKSGYDRGHLAPSADFSWNQKANDLTFVMSNMAPQTSNLNRGPWKRLEDKIRRWACGEEHVKVITGVILEGNEARLKSGLIIPNKFYKIVIDETPPKKSIAFIYHQNDRGDILEKRVVETKMIESQTKVAFSEIYPILNESERRVPASIKEWKEKDCSK